MANAVMTPIYSELVEEMGDPFGDAPLKMKDKKEENTTSAAKEVEAETQVMEPVKPKPARTRKSTARTGS